MTTIRGEIQAGDAKATVAAIARRQRGSVWTYYILLVALIAAGGLLGWGVGRLVGIDLTVFGIVIGSVTYLIFGRRFALTQFRGQMKARNLSTALAIEVSITESVLKYKISDISKEAPWSSVTELFISKGYWIFMVRTEPWFAPSKFFANNANERAFVAKALSHMSDEARARSTPAAKFAA